VLTQRKRKNSGSEGRAARLAAVRDALANLRGLAVGRIAFRTGRLVVWLRSADGHEPELALRFLGVAAFRDDGIAGRDLSNGQADLAGPWGRAIAASEARPELADCLQVDFWSERDRSQPMLQVLARDVRVFAGAALTQPDRIWTAKN